MKQMSGLWKSKTNTDPEPTFNTAGTTASHVKHYQHPSINVTATELI